MEKFLLLNIGKEMEAKLMDPVGAIEGKLKKCESGVAYFELEDGKQWIVSVDKIVAVSVK
jgi:Domain of unknown function (DUF6897)